MRTFTQNWQVGHLRMVVNNVRRRRAWFADGATPRQLANLALAGTECVRRAERMRAWPVVVKLDISPLCNLRCTYCVHALPGEGSHPALAEQRFRGHQRIKVAQVDRIMGEVAGRSMAPALYYLGDPLMHPDLDAICAITAGHGLRCHISSNFSFALSDQRLVNLVSSGLTHLTVCVDGIRQESYERTRVGGRINRVFDNLQRTLAVRRELGAERRLMIEVQYIRYQHNEDQVAETARWCAERGVDMFTDYWGNLHNYTDETPGSYRVLGPKAQRALPQCLWPHFAMQIKYDGDVIPCCYFRHSEQYRPGGDARVIGNALESGVFAFWNSLGYQALRRLVSNPTRSATEPALRETFCDGCPTVFETEIPSYTAHAHRGEDLYVRDAHGEVRRRPVVDG